MSWLTVGVEILSAIPAGNICKLDPSVLQAGACYSHQSSWLNEGWTVYLERRILAGLHNDAHRDFSAIIGWKSLRMFPNMPRAAPDNTSHANNAL
jgi:hypothetical protein